MIKKSLFTYLSNALFFKVLVFWTSLAKLSFIVGSMAGFFSLSSAITPLSGELVGVGGAIAFTLLQALTHILIKGSFSWHFLAYYIPGFFAALYWSSPSKLVRIVPAIICMILFIMHPIGAGAALYSLFWLIPIYCAVQEQPTPFMRALGTTFTAHALGSTIWLYTLGMSADQWLMLIPVVIIERLAVALSMVGAYAILRKAITVTPAVFARFTPIKS